MIQGSLEGHGYLWRMVDSGGRLSPLLAVIELVEQRVELGAGPSFARCRRTKGGIMIEAGYQCSCGGWKGCTCQGSCRGLPGRCACAIAREIEDAKRFEESRQFVGEYTEARAWPLWKIFYSLYLWQLYKHDHRSRFLWRLSHRRSTLGTRGPSRRPLA